MRFFILIVAAVFVCTALSRDESRSEKEPTIRVILTGAVEPSGEITLESTSLLRLIRSGRLTIDPFVTHVFVERRGESAWHGVKLRDLTAERDFSIRDGDKLMFERAHEN